MPCQSANYPSTSEQADPAWINWSGRVSGPTSHYCKPQSLRDLVSMVHRATTLGEHVRAVGSAWSFENIAYCPDWMIDIGNLTHPLETVIPNALNSAWSNRP